MPIPHLRRITLTIEVPIRDDYPWKAGQPPAPEALIEAAQDGIQHLDCIDKARRIRAIAREQDDADSRG